MLTHKMHYVVENVHMKMFAAMAQYTKKRNNFSKVDQQQIFLFLCSSIQSYHPYPSKLFFFSITHLDLLASWLK